MKYFFPKSLIGQLLALVAVTLLIAQAVNAVLLYRGERTQHRIEAGTSAVGRIAGEIERANERRVELGERRRRGPPRMRRSRPMLSDASAVTDSMRRLPEMEVRAAQAFVNLGTDLSAVEIGIVEELPKAMQNNVVGLGPIRRMERQFGNRSKRREMFNERRPKDIAGFMILSAKSTDGQWVSIASVIRERNRNFLGMLVFQTLILYLILLIPLLFLGRYISRPLKQLTQSASDYQPGSTDPVDESGPPDTRKLIAAFNAMNGRVGAMLDEKDVMLGAIGHDLRTPLAALRVRVESVEDTTERDRMIAGIEDMDAMLDDILSLARVGRSQEKREPTNITALIDTVVDEFVDLEKDVSFAGADRIVAPIRATLVRRALRNLIDNAVAYGERATISVDKSGDKSGKTLSIHVDDIGPGISEADMAGLFEPFVRAETSRNRATGGSGLGLTLARSIARDHGGDIILQNREEGGLRASLVLLLD